METPGVTKCTVTIDGIHKHFRKICLQLEVLADAADRKDALPTPKFPRPLGFPRQLI